MQFEHGEEQTKCYCDRHAVDDDDNYGQDFSPFKEAFPLLLESKTLRMCHIGMSNQLASGKCQLFTIRRGKNLSEPENVRGLAKELIENEEWAIKKCVVGENAKKQAKNAAEGWRSMNY